MLTQLIRRRGGVPRVAPALQEVPLPVGAAVGALLDTLTAGEVEAVVSSPG